MVSLPWLIDHIEDNWQVLGKNFWPYGLEPNRASVTALARWTKEQGLAPRVVAPEELFVPVDSKLT